MGSGWVRLPAHGFKFQSGFRLGFESRHVGSSPNPRCTVSLTQKETLTFPLTACHLDRGAVPGIDVSPEVSAKNVGEVWWEEILGEV